jgi:hypothetical protein
MHPYAIVHTIFVHKEISKKIKETISKTRRLGPAEHFATRLAPDGKKKKKSSATCTHAYMESTEENV